MKSNKGGGLEKQKARWAWLFIAPWIVGITVFFAVCRFVNDVLQKSENFAEG